MAFPTNRATRKGPGAVLGPLESDVMNALWTLGHAASVGDVVAFFERHGKRPAYSTIKTILNILTGKGYLRKQPDGRANIFTPIQTKTEFERAVVGDVVSGLLRDYRNPLIAHMADKMAADPESLAEFERLLAQRKQALA